MVQVQTYLKVVPIYSILGFILRPYRKVGLCWFKARFRDKSVLHRRLRHPFHRVHTWRFFGLL